MMIFGGVGQEDQIEVGLVGAGEVMAGNQMGQDSGDQMGQMAGRAGMAGVGGPYGSCSRWWGQEVGGRAGGPDGRGWWGRRGDGREPD